MYVASVTLHEIQLYTVGTITMYFKDNLSPTNNKILWSSSSSSSLFLSSLFIDYLYIFYFLQTYTNINIMNIFINNETINDRPLKMHEQSTCIKEKQKIMFQFTIHVKGSGFQTALYKLKYFIHACMSWSLTPRPNFYVDRDKL